MPRFFKVQSAIVVRANGANCFSSVIPCLSFCHRVGASRPWRSSHNKVARIRVTNMMKYILPGPRGQKAPHKNIRFCGDPAPRGDKEESNGITQNIHI